jgi:hypothetical protein
MCSFYKSSRSNRNDKEGKLINFSCLWISFQRLHWQGNKIKKIKERGDIKDENRFDDAYDLMVLLGLQNCDMFLPNELNRIHDEILMKFVEGG